MTMPHLMNCEHMPDGWCLHCVGQLHKDAERLDYIAGNARCDPKMDGQHVWWPTSFNHRLTGPTLRDAIDAAMAPKRDGAA